MNLTDSLAGGRGAQAQTDRIHGVVSGLVKDNKDPEGLARVKVTFPWLEGETHSDWAKVVCFMAGPERGAWFLPEVGDEVLVAFEHGDVHHPYVLGGLWSSEDKPCETNGDGKNNTRKIRSRSGHELIFGDDHEGGQEKVEIHTKAGHKILLSDARGSERIEIQDKNGSNKIRIDSVQGSIELESERSLKIKSQQIEIEAGATMKISANGTLEIRGSMVKIN
jgi:uncharacterized protein involved in type VI secretion and phage assembly